ncbi:MFS transporter, partial [Streptomyces sp. NPDC046977]|uniref:MFS transporter n=1 Tax=Streptomyces sp. NPDC046977 TaxID=3154703 RepID=UPI0033C80C23
MTRIAAASAAGTAIEFYDFFAYGTAAALVLGPLFFPAFSPVAGTLAAFGTFAVGFVARPLGSVLFGHIGDRLGRRPVLMGSLLLTGASTTAVGLVPSYDAIGAAAPVILVALRFLQGLGLGGEWGGAVLLAAEHAPARRRGLWASLPQTGPAVGFVLANGIVLALSAGLSDTAFRSWGWRVPFWAAGALALAGLALRAALPETPQFERAAERGELSRVPLVELLRGHWRLLLLTAGAMACGYAVFYTVTTWSLAYATERLGMDRTVVLGCVLAAVVVKGAATPWAGLLGDRFGRRPLALAGTAAMGVVIFPYAWLLGTGSPAALVLGSAAQLLAFIAVFAVLGAYLPELYPPHVRCTGASLGYNLGGILGGALTPVAATRLAGDGGGAPWAVAVYVAAVALLSTVCFAALPDPRRAVAATRVDERTAATAAGGGGPARGGPPRGGAPAG